MKEAEKKRRQVASLRMNPDAEKCEGTRFAFDTAISIERHLDAHAEKWVRMGQT
jgi:hypothetical protein